MIIYWPISMFGADITNFALKKEYADKYEDWYDLFCQNNNKILHIEADHHGKKLVVPLTWATTADAYDEGAYIYIGIPSYFVFTQDGKYLKQFSREDITKAVVTFVQRYSDASEEEIREEMDYIEDVGVSN